MSRSWPCSMADEDVFGPTVDASCHHGFDFTLLFEEIVLALIPITLSWLTTSIRVWTLWHASEEVNRSWLYAAKQIALLLHITIQLVMLAIWCQSSTPTTRLTIPTAIAGIITFCFFLYLSHLEHIHSLRPSSILCLFFVLTIPFDLTRLRTLHFIPDNKPITLLFAGSILGKIIILVLESTEKTHLLKKAFEGSAIESTAGIINRCLFWWTNDLLWKGWKNTLTVEGLPLLADDIRDASDPEQLAEKWNKANKYRSNALLWTFAAHFKWDFLAGVIPRLAFTGLGFTQPFLVERVLDFMSEPEHVNSDNYARGLVGAYAIVYLGLGISFAAFHHKIDRLITKMRGSLVALIFNKTLRMSSLAVSDASAITLMSTDIDRIGTGLRDVHEIYSNFIEAILALWLLARLLKLATVASSLLMIACLVGGIPLAVASGNAQGVWLEAIEERVAVTSKVLGGMKSIKMTGLTDVISDIVRKLRSQEIKASFIYRLYTVLVTTFSYASSALAPVFGFGVYALLAHARDGETLTNGVAFSALTLFSLLNYPMISFVYGSEDLMAVVNCFQRIQKHLLETERSDCRIDHESQVTELIDVDSTDEDSQRSSSVVIQNVSAAWSIDDEPILKDMNLNIPAEKTTMIVGPVGSGKSTLLKVLLGEVPECTGSISTSFRNAAYCAQSPWITFGTVQQNILGASQLDQRYYDRIIQACSLQLDLQQLPLGDQTKVGVRGSRLSGGQQMRVAFARALYSRQSVLLLDDVLTGLDRETEKCILEAVFARQGLIKDFCQTAILATNSAHHLPYADFIISLNEDGHIIEQGTYEELIAAKGYVSNLANSSSTVNTERPPDVVLDDEALQELKVPDDDQVDDTSRQTGDLSVYLYYFRNVGWPLLLLFFGCSALFVCGLNFPQIWLEWWTRANEEKPNENVGYWIGGYAALGILTLLSTFLANWVFGMIIVPKTARRFHEILLGTTMSSTTSFLTSTDIGATTNRFSQDLELIDEELPICFKLTLNAALSCIIEAFLIFIGSSYVTVAIIPFCVLAVYYVARYYIRTSRQIRLLEIETKAPLFSQFLDALTGLPSIRAYGWSEHYRVQNRIALDASQRPFYMLYCIQRWLSLVLDLIVAGIAVSVVSIVTSMRGSSSLALFGITFFNIVNFSATLHDLVSEWTALESSIGAVSRIRSYVRNAKTEDLDSETETLPPFWPEKGVVEFFGVSASYDAGSEPVLQDINLKIRAGEKVALCGRTGSGKSSLISTLLRTLDHTSGTIHIDNIDITKTPRSQIRSHLNTIPQQPLFLPGSVRLNANPEGDVEDNVIIDTLREVNLWSLFESKGGLDADLDEESHLSHGQRQLFCLVRALCKSSSSSSSGGNGNGILVLDEVTSSMDSETDTLIQQIIRTRFKNQTIIAIAHKLDTVLDFDKIAFMDGGRVVEFDSPGALLEREGSGFRAMFENFSHPSS